jgi:hypothetical protein
MARWLHSVFYFSSFHPIAVNLYETDVITDNILFLAGNYLGNIKLKLQILGKARSWLLCFLIRFSLCVRYFTYFEGISTSIDLEKKSLQQSFPWNNEVSNLSTTDAKTRKYLKV